MQLQLLNWSALFSLFCGSTTEASLFHFILVFNPLRTLSLIGLSSFLIFSEFCSIFPSPYFDFFNSHIVFPALGLPYAHLSPSASVSLLLPFFCLCPSRLHQSFSGIFAAAYLFLLLLCLSSIFILYFISSHPLRSVSFSNGGFLLFPFDV